MTVQLIKFNGQDVLLVERREENTQVRKRTVAIDIGNDNIVDAVYVEYDSGIAEGYLYVKGAPQNNLLGKSAEEAVTSLRQMLGTAWTEAKREIPYKMLFSENGFGAKFRDHEEKGKAREEREIWRKDVAVEPKQSFVNSPMFCSRETRDYKNYCVDSEERYEISYITDLIKGGIEELKRFSDETKTHLDAGQKTISGVLNAVTTARVIINREDNDLEDFKGGECLITSALISIFDTNKPKEPLFCFDFTRSDQETVCFSKEYPEYKILKECRDDY